MRPQTVSVFVDDQQLGVEDVQAEHDRLVAAGVAFTMPPAPMGPVIVAVLDGTVGNLLQLAQPVC